ncbi:MAG: hypothetical protein M1838_005172 [Thelocarpon superellum]|nr:MAG: hypothetical protein M1838_005172 [Thelocarpon superellum]
MKSVAVFSTLMVLVPLLMADELPAGYRLASLSSGKPDINQRDIVASNGSLVIGDNAISSVDCGPDNVAVSTCSPNTALTVVDFFPDHSCWLVESGPVAQQLYVNDTTGALLYHRPNSSFSPAARDGDERTGFNNSIQAIDQTGTGRVTFFKNQDLQDFVGCPTDSLYYIYLNLTSVQLPKDCIPLDIVSEAVNSTLTNVYQY